MENTENKNIIDYKVKRTRYYLGDSEQFIEIDEGDMNMPIRIQQMKKDICSKCSDKLPLVKELVEIFKIMRKLRR